MRDAILLALDHKRDAGQLDADRHATVRHASSSRSSPSSGWGRGADQWRNPDRHRRRLHRRPMDIWRADAGTVRVEESPNASIPDNQPDGVTRTLTVSAAGSCTHLTVSVDIQHPFIGDLRVSLIPPGGAPIVLHNRTGGAADNLVQSYRSEDVPALGAVVGRRSGELGAQDRGLGPPRRRHPAALGARDRRGGRPAGRPGRGLPGLGHPR